MPKYRVYMETGASTHFEVEAENKDEAVDIALSEHRPYVCAQCGGWGNEDGVGGIEIGDEWDVKDYDRDVEVLSDE